MTPQWPRDWSRQLHKGSRRVRLCSAPALLLPFCTIPWPPCLLAQYAIMQPVCVSSILRSVMSQCRAVITQLQTVLSSPHICLSVRCGKLDRMITQHAPCFHSLLESQGKNEKWAREESRKHWTAQKAMGQIESNSAVVLLVLIELHWEMHTQTFHWFVSRQLVKIF